MLKRSRQESPSSGASGGNQMEQPLLDAFGHEGSSHCRAGHTEQHDGLSSLEWREASENVKVPKPFYDATVIARAKRHALLPAQVPIIFGMSNCLGKFSGIAEFHRGTVKEGCTGMFLDPHFTMFKTDDVVKRSREGWVSCPTAGTTNPAARKQESVQPLGCDIWDAFDVANGQAGNTTPPLHRNGELSHIPRWQC